MSAAEGAQRPGLLERARCCAPLALVGYTVLGVLFLHRAWADPRHVTLQGGDGDPGLFIWFLANTSRALTTGHGLLVTTRLNAPEGVNTMWNTSLLLPGALLSWLTALAGPLLTFNALVTAGPVLTAWSAHLAARRFVQTTAARTTVALVVGCVTAIPAYAAHVHLSLLMLVPPLLLVSVDAATGHRSPVRSGLLLGALVASQLLIGEEVLVLTAGTVALLLVLLGLQRPRLALRRLRDLAVTTLVTAGVVLAVDGYPLWVQFLGPLRQHGALLTPDTYKLDPAEIVASGSHLLLHPQAPSGLLVRGQLGTSELLGHLGLPLLVVVAVVAVVRRRDLAVRTTAATIVALTVLACGSTLVIAGHRTGISLPWAAATRLPLLDALLPVRWMILAGLLAAGLAGVAVDAVARQGWGRLPSAALAAAVILPLVPLPPAASSTGVPAFFAQGAPGVTGTALVVPLSDPPSSRTMTWQATAGMRFATPRGYFVGPGTAGRARFGARGRPTAARLNALTARGTRDVVSASDRDAARADFAYWGVTTVLLGPTRHQDAVRRFLTSLLGHQPELSGGVYVWRQAAVSA